MKSDNRSDSKKLGQMLMERGRLRKEQVPKLLKLQKQDSTAGVQSKFGELCVRTGWVDAGDVTTTLIKQKKDRSESVGLGDILISLKYLAPEQLQDSLETKIDVFDTLEEIVIDRGFCTPEQIHVANQLLSLHRNGAARQPVVSTFVPFNIMELLIAEQLDEALKLEGGCRCSQCWGNTFSAALNDLPPRYISDHGRILDCVSRFRQEYSQLVQSKLANAVARVRANPKAACRPSPWGRSSYRQ